MKLHTIPVYQRPGPSSFKQDFFQILPIEVHVKKKKKKKRLPYSTKG